MRSNRAPLNRLNRSRQKLPAFFLFAHGHESKMRPTLLKGGQSACADLSVPRASIHDQTT
jgi:hypothetical protein